MIPLKPIIHRILKDYALPCHGIHGVGHWARVLENGLRLAKETKANVEIVQLFAIFHDSCRVNEGSDFSHGRRGQNWPPSCVVIYLISVTRSSGCSTRPVRGIRMA